MHKLESSQTRALSGFYPHFSVLQNAIHEKTRVFLFHGFFVRIFKTRVKDGFLLNLPLVVMSKQ